MENQKKTYALLNKHFAQIESIIHIEKKIIEKHKSMRGTAYL